MKIRYNQYHLFSRDYWMMGRYPNQRFGQAFCNTFNIIDDSDLFYEENPVACAYHISALYIDFSMEHPLDTFSPM